jgi:hypothetical protein
MRGAPVTGWPDIEAVLGPPLPAAARTVAADRATAVLPTDVLRQLAPGEGGLVARGPAYSTARLEQQGWRHGWAIRLGGGLLISLIQS